MALLGIPLLVIPFAIYNILALLLGLTFTETMFRVTMLSQAEMGITVGDLLVILGILLLYAEIVKATRLGARAILDHVLSLLLFIAMAAEFMIVQRAATATFMFLVLLSFVDVIGGFSITIRTSQRDIAFEGPERIG